MQRVPMVGWLWFAAGVAQAASITGQITDGANGVPGMEVRLWAATPKGFSLQAMDAQVVNAAADGSYTITGIPAGTYRLDTRMAPLTAGNWGDRWLDVVPPLGQGYVASDADDVVLAADTDLTGVNITVELNGGLDGTVLLDGALSAGIQIIAEQRGDVRIHHSDRSQDLEHQGEFSMRGLHPGSYRLLAHDPNGVRADLVHAPALDVVSNVNLPGPALDLPVAPGDPLEPNNSMATATAVDSNLFAQMPAQPFTAQARIAPRNSGDVDWYCYDARAGDRFKVHARGVITLEDNSVRESPWMDPVLALWTAGDGGMVLAFEDDDNGPGARDALVDTGELAVGGQHCVVVTAFGDTTYTGTTQASAGDYTLTVELGNRGPSFGATLSTPDGGAPLPAPPLSLQIAEGETLTFLLTFADPENDSLNATYDLQSANGTSQTAGSLNTAGGTATFEWTASQTAARGSPYTLLLRVTDGEFTRTITVLIRVTAVNVPPGLPVLLTPTDGEIIQTQGPRLICAEAYDPDLQTLTYEVEVFFGDAGVPARTGTATGVDGGYDADAGGTAPTVSWQVTGIPENTRARWRVRAFDGDQSNGYSGWTAFSHFLVDLMNDPPPPPVLTKPTFNETLNVIRPTLAVRNVVDPEEDAVEFSFEVSATNDFATVLVTSPWIPQAAGTTTTMWTVEQDLTWDTRYFARARGRDNRGGTGEYSNANPFLIQSNQRPGVPPFLTPPTSACNGGNLASFPLSVVVGQVVDPEMDAITVQLQVFAGNVDPDTTTPLFDQTLTQGATSTSFDVSAVTGQQLQQYRLRTRAMDPTGPSLWGDCRFVLNNGMNASSSSSASGGGSGSSSSGGAGSSGGAQSNGSGGIISRVDGGGGSTPPDEDPSGCACQGGTVPAPWGGVMALGLVWWVRRRRHG